MGIRFYCPQGHKLNVKSFLAGKRGFCPYCNAKVDIPLESTRGSSKDGGDEPKQNLAVPTSAPAGAQVGGGAAPVATPVSQPRMNVPMARPVGAAGGQPATAAQPAPAKAAQPAPMAARLAASAAPAPVPAPAMADPISEAPHAVWYVRPASGGQFGPATGQIMQQWINEGRVAADSLVWREGWPDWKAASATFPKFASRPGY